MIHTWWDGDPLPDGEYHHIRCYLFYDQTVPVFEWLEESPYAVWMTRYTKSRFKENRPVGSKYVHFCFKDLEAAVLFKLVWQGPISVAHDPRKYLNGIHVSDK